MAKQGDPFAIRGASSARALLLVVLGEFALPRDRPVWNSTIVDALSLLDLEQAAVGQAVRRAAATGLLLRIRAGRRAAWQLTDRGSELLRAGGERVYGFSGVTDDWDGRWLMLSVSVPERDKALRHPLRRELQWLGFGSPAPALWVSPHAGRADAARAAVEEVGLGRATISSLGPFGPIGDERGMVEAAWDLDDLAGEYRSFIGTFGRLRPATDDDVFRAHVALTQSWRRFPYLDPVLPRRFLPERWPGEDAAALFDARREEWLPRSRDLWGRLCAREPAA